MTVKSQHGDYFFEYPQGLPTPPSETDFGYELQTTETEQYQQPSFKQQQRFMMPMKKQQHMAMPTIDMAQGLFPTTTPMIETSPVLTPCHVCHKAPRVKKELDAYEDCWRCRKRSCFICMRQCQIPAGCGGRKVCRGCCMEQGEEGHVSCLDCLQRHEGGGDCEMEMEL